MGHDGGVGGGGRVISKSEVDANVGGSSRTRGRKACVNHAKTDKDESSTPPLDR